MARNNAHNSTPVLNRDTMLEGHLHDAYCAGMTPHSSQGAMLISAVHHASCITCITKTCRGITALLAHAGSDSSKASSLVTVLCLQGGGSVNYWVGAVDARNKEYAQLMRKFQVEANLHDATKRSLSEQRHDKQALQVSCINCNCTYHGALSPYSPLHRLHVCKLRSNAVIIVAHEVVVMALAVVWRLDCTSNIAELLCIFSWLGGCALPLTQGQELLPKW